MLQGGGVVKTGGSWSDTSGCPIDLEFLSHISITPRNLWLHGADMNHEKRIFWGGLMFIGLSKFPTSRDVDLSKVASINTF